MRPLCHGPIENVDNRPTSNSPRRPPTIHREPEQLGVVARGEAYRSSSSSILSDFSAESGQPFLPRVDWAQRLASPFRHYLQATYLNHGYRFFAPNPEPSHLIRYEADTPDGTVEGVWPDRLEHWPRLNYHRHLMISESVFMLTNLPDLASVAADDQAEWQRQRNVAIQLIQSVREHLRAKHGATDVRMWLVEHQLASPLDVAAGMPIDAPELYVERGLDDFEAIGQEVTEPTSDNGGEQVDSRGNRTRPIPYRAANDVGLFPSIDPPHTSLESVGGQP